MIPAGPPPARITCDAMISIATDHDESTCRTENACRTCDGRADGCDPAGGLAFDRHRHAWRRHRVRIVCGRTRSSNLREGLVHPWSLAFLPDGRMLVTERPGRMRIVTAEGQLSPPLKGVPEVWASGQGGLLDVAIDKSFAQNRTIYFCFAERTGGGGRTAVARAKLNDGNGRLDDAKIIFRQEDRCRRAITMAAASCRQRRQSVRHAGRTFQLSRRGAESRQSSRQADPDRARRLGAGRQPVHRPRRCQAGNLELRPPQRTGARDQSGVRRSLGDRARPARRRRGQHHRQGQEITAGR